MQQLQSSKKNILLVEDDTELRDKIKEALEKAGYSVVCAGNGNEATLKLKNQEFEMVVSDLNMPKKDGVTLANEIIATNIPVLLITGELETFELRLKALAGVMLLPKPFKIEIIPALVSKILKTKAAA